MTWHYRIGVATEGDEKTYGIVEFYPEYGHTGFVWPGGDSIEELREDLITMLQDTYRDEPPIEIEIELEAS